MHLIIEVYGFDIFFVFFKDLSSKNATYYGNRSAAYLALGKHKDAVEDARMATSIDENYVKVCLQNIILKMITFLKKKRFFSK